ncbi:MAG: PQQ-binding-like beta-propeller repeat protein [Anaerolineae bacterium]
MTLCPIKINIEERAIKRLLFLIVLLGSIALLAACGGGAAPAGWSAATVVNQVVYFGGTDAKFYALDANTGTAKWSYAGDKDKPLTGIYGQPAVDNGMVYFGALNGQLYALDAGTGAVKWQYDATAATADRRGITSSPLVAGGVVYFGANDHNFYALNASDGSFKWKFETLDKVWGDATLDNGTLYVGSLDHHLYALGLDGVKKWDYDAGGMILSRPAVTNGMVYFGALENLIALDAATGAFKWKQSYAPDHWIWSSITVQNGVLYFSDLGGEVHAVDPANGQSRWPQPFVAGGPVRSGIALAAATSDATSNKGFVGAGNNKLYALTLTSGVKSWEYLATAPFYATPAVDNDTIYVSSHALWFYALRAVDGGLKWAFDLSKGQPGTPPAAQ